MSVLIADEILDAIEEELGSAETSVRVITAYCKLEAIRRLSNSVKPCVLDKKLVLRFKMGDIVAGSTDFDVVNYCFENGWQVYARLDLHAKTYIVDNRRGIIGSANATNAGMSMSRQPNLEMAALVDLTPQDLTKVERLLSGAVLVTQELAKDMEAELKRQDEGVDGSSLRWSPQIMNQLQPKVETLFSHELPDYADYSEGDYIAFLDFVYDGNIEPVKDRFRWCNAYLWLLNALDDHGKELYFGELSSLLHSALIEDPRPYRKDVKVLLSNLLSLIEAFNMDEIMIDRPRHSQRIRLVAQAG